MNVALHSHQYAITVDNSDQLLDIQQLPEQGVGIFSLNSLIQQLNLYPATFLSNKEGHEEIVELAKQRLGNEDDLAQGYMDYIVDALELIASVDKEKPVRISLPDLTTNKIANLEGGQPLNNSDSGLGIRGVSHLLSDTYQQAFKLECKAIAYTRNELGLTNIELVVPFVRTATESAQIIDKLAENGLYRGVNGLKVSYHCATPSAALLSSALLKYFDGVVIDTSLLTQFTLAIDLSSAELSSQFDPANKAVIDIIEKTLQAAKSANKPSVLMGLNLTAESKLFDQLEDDNIDTISLSTI
ncbi:hypothetical protein L0B53_13735 [Vibrio sp. SS-MA-C1-2]|uniref:putative PEP-binding protein n=1 Tax=Vibrio sp. SS-MA-C1-2 TaxID=2908646 RepID=UPI001F1DCC86|nr:putative PEP-binding protein [Vibrio sp. SS-MA-C1-2]UJF18077.1 hypothetical protein L0B53_13735 [Vibrio sp. SS-MA-C1-2]